jgi:perosamine synthetase
MEGVAVFREPNYARSNYWLNVLMLDEKFSPYRDELLGLTNRREIMTRPVWTLMHRLPMYRNCPRMDLHTAENLERRIINLPSSAFLVEPYS